MVVAIAFAGCGPKKIPPGAGNMSGKIPLVLRNDSPTEVCEAQLKNPAADSFKSYLVCSPTPFKVDSGYSNDTCEGPCLQPGETRQFSVAEGKYEIWAQRKGAAHDGFALTTDLDIKGPTEVVYGHKEKHLPPHDGLVVYGAEWEPHAVGIPGSDDGGGGACTPNGQPQTAGHPCCSGVDESDNQGFWRCAAVRQ